MKNTILKLHFFIVIILYINNKKFRGWIDVLLMMCKTRPIRCKHIHKLIINKQNKRLILKLPSHGETDIHTHTHFCMLRRHKMLYMQITLTWLSIDWFFRLARNAQKLICKNLWSMVGQNDIINNSRTSTMANKLKRSNENEQWQRYRCSHFKVKSAIGHLVRRYAFVRTTCVCDFKLM